jgi:hypothetical protein
MMPDSVSSTWMFKPIQWPNYGPSLGSPDAHFIVWHHNSFSLFQIALLWYAQPHSYLHGLDNMRSNGMGIYCTRDLSLPRKSFIVLFWITLGLQ